MKIKLIFIFAALLALFRISLLITHPVYIDSDSIEYLYFSRSIFLINSADFIEFGKLHGYLLLFVPVVYYKLISLIAVGIHAYKLAQVFLIITSTVFFTKLTLEMLKKYSLSNLFGYLSLLIFSLMPWGLHLGTFDLKTHLALTLFIITSYFYIKQNTKPTFISLLLLTFSSFSGLIFGNLFSVYLSVKNSKYRFFTTLLVFLSIMVILSNKVYLKNIYEKTFLYEITPQVVSKEITDSIMNAHLGSNKEIIIPTLIQKIALNKYVVILSKTFNKSISLFDFEHWASPLSSYAILTRSGILPKGSWPAISILQIPLLAAGLYFTIKKKLHSPAIFILAIVSSILAFTIFSKRELLSNGVLFLVPIVYLTSFCLINIKQKSIFYLVILILITSFLGKTKFFYTFQNDFRYTHGYFYKEIADFIDESSSNYEQIVVTDRFGPTFLAASYYIDIPPERYWSQFTHSDKAYENLLFKSFDTTSNFQTGTVYLGLMGEFIGKINEENYNYDKPEDFEFIKEIRGWNAPVTNFGNKLWIAKKLPQ